MNRRETNCSHRPPSGSTPINKTKSEYQKTIYTKKKFINYSIPEKTNTQTDRSNENIESV